MRRLGKIIKSSLIVIMIIVLIYCLKINIEKKEFTQYTKQAQELIKSHKEEIKNKDGTTYYISANGKSTEGTDINNPMSLNMANTKTFLENDRILLKSGDIFYGIIDFNVRTQKDKHVYIGAYGEGDKPIISGANILINEQAWILEDSLYKIDLSNYRNFEGIDKKHYESYNIGFIADEKGKIYGNRKQNKRMIDNEFDFYCENNYLYIKCSENPSKKLGKIKFVSRNDLVKLSSNMIIENINIQYTGAHGIVKKNEEIENVIIKNCIIENIGGSVQIEDTFTRYGNGVEFWNSARNTLVEKCIFRNIYDAGYTVQGNTVTTGFENNVCKENVFINCTYPYEISCRNKNTLSQSIYLREQKFINNISINQGRGWGYEVRPYKDSVAEFVLWSMPTNDTNIQIIGNSFINSKMLQFKSSYYEMPSEEYKKCIQSDNNKIYLSNDTCLINSKGNYQNREILKKYEIEQNSTFKLLTKEELTKINNQSILYSNDYGQIKNYYEGEENYIIKENNIKNIKHMTSKAEFDNNIKADIAEEYKIIRIKENEQIELKDTDVIASGDIVKTNTGSEYTIIVAGDLTKDGNVNIDDFIRMRKFLLGIYKLDGIEALAADANIDEEELSISDYIRIRKLILNQLINSDM